MANFTKRASAYLSNAINPQPNSDELTQGADPNSVGVFGQWHDPDEGQRHNHTHNVHHQHHHSNSAHYQQQQPLRVSEDNRSARNAGLLHAMDLGGQSNHAQVHQHQHHQPQPHSSSEMGSQLAHSIHASDEIELIKSAQLQQQQEQQHVYPTYQNSRAAARSTSSLGEHNEKTPMPPGPTATNGFSHRTPGEGLTKFPGGEDMDRGQSHFHLAHSSSGGYIAEMGPDVPIKLTHLFKRPLIRQWIYDGKIYRETSERVPSRYELFFDLSWVGVSHKLADGVAEKATALNVGKFLIVFYLSWSVWLDVRTFINQSGTDDVWQRLYLLLLMILLAALAGNATGVLIADTSEAHEAAAEGEAASAHGGVVEGEGASADHGSATGESSVADAGHGSATSPEVSGETPPAAASTSGGHGGGGHGGAGALTPHQQEHVARAVISGAGYLLRKRAGGGEEAHEEPTPDLDAHIFGPYYFAEGWHTPLFWAICFFLVAKAARILILLVYGVLLPRFRKALFLQALFLLLTAAVFLPIMFTNSPAAVMLLCVLGVVVDMNIKYIIAASNQWLHRRSKRSGKTHSTFFPAVSVEHIAERMLLFCILVIGEAILNSTYSASQPDEYGFSEIFGRSALAIIIAFMLMWIYFDADGSRTFVHALRRHWWNAISFTNVHYPLCASLILMSSALAKLVASPEIAQGFVWYFSGSLACAMLCIAYIALIHESLDLHRSAWAPTSLRIVVRACVAILFALLPLRHDWDSMGLLAVHAAILAAVVAFETLGKIGAIGRVYDEGKAAELEQWRLAKAARSQYPNDGADMNEQHPMTQLHQRNESLGSLAQIKNGSQVILNNARSKLDKYWDMPKATSKDTWHTYEDLSYNERGEEDVGNEGELGQVEAQPVIISSRRWALASL